LAIRLAHCISMLEIAIATAEKKKLKQAGWSYCVSISMPCEAHAPAVSKSNAICPAIFRWPAGRITQRWMEMCSLDRSVAGSGGGSSQSQRARHRLRYDWAGHTCTDAPRK
jgi:hypothetical protein